MKVSNHQRSLVLKQSSEGSSADNKITCFKTKLDKFLEGVVCESDSRGLDNDPRGPFQFYVPMTAVGSSLFVIEYCVDKKCIEQASSLYPNSVGQP